MTGGEKIVGLGPRRGEASLSSTALSLRKTLHWGSAPSVPLPPCSVQGCCLTGSCLSPTPGAQCSSLPFSPHPPLVFPRQPWTSAAKGTTRSRVECLEGLRCTQLSPFTRIHDWQQWLLPLPLPLAPSAAHPFHSQSKVTESSIKLCVFTGA